MRSLLQKTTLFNSCIPESIKCTFFLNAYHIHPYLMQRHETKKEERKRTKEGVGCSSEAGSMRRWRSSHSSNICSPVKERVGPAQQVTYWPPLGGEVTGKGDNKICGKKNEKEGMGV